MSSSDRALGGDATTAGWFLFEVDGVPIGTFRKLSGLSVRLGTHRYVEGGQNDFVHTFPGVLEWPNLVFERGLVESDALFAWVRASAGEGAAANNDRVTRSTGAVTALDYQGNRLRAWELDAVFAVAWDGPTFDVESNATLVERLEVAHEGFRSKTS